jgi:hypothetical protein
VGSATMLDIIGSMVIGSLLLLSALAMNEKATSNTFQAQSSLTVQQNITSIVENLEWDFRLIGYCRNNDTLSANSFIISGDTNSVTFQADVNNDGIVDTLSWYLEPWQIPGCPNPNARILVRKVSGQNGVAGVDSSNLGVTQFSLAYFNELGDTVHTPFVGDTAGVQVIQVTVTVQPVASYADTLNRQVFSTWRQTRLVSKNLNSR